MNATELANLSMSELKSICLDRVISVNGDRRLKASYISAIAAFHQHQEEIASVPTDIIADPFDEQIEIPVSAPIAIGRDGYGAILQGEATANKPNHSHQLAIEIEPDIPSLLPSPQQYSLHASIVLLLPLILVIALLLAVKTIFTSLILSITALSPVIAGIRRSIENRQSPISIDYFPLPI